MLQIIYFGFTEICDKLSTLSTVIILKRSKANERNPKG